MSGRRITPAEKEEALAALYASAVLQDGELIPNYKQVAHLTRIHRKTLKGWFTKRDRSKDAHYCAPMLQARNMARQRGALATVEDLRRVVELGIQHLSQASSWEDVQVHQAARALESIARSHERLVAILSDPEEDKSTSTIDRAREAVRRTGLGRLLRGDDT
jgi:hypothetical protein